MSQSLRSWPEVIKHYIDELKELEKKDQYVDELVAIFLSKKLRQVRADCGDEKTLKKIIGKIKGTPASSGNRKRFEDCYQQLLAKGWIVDLSTSLKRIRDKSDFYNIWICRSVELSQGVLPATHAAKLTHSSSSGSSILDRSGTKNDAYLTTSSLSTEIIDGTYLNASASRQAKFLLLYHNQSYLFDALEHDCRAVFGDFADSEEELNGWLNSYRAILSQTPKTDTLLKQIYFPVAAQDYHLLSVLRSSSLAQRLYDSHFSEEARKVQKTFQQAKNKNRYISGVHSQPVHISKLMTTQSQPQNASMLNGKRGGALRLLSCQPPIWKTQLKPPIHNTSWFYRGIPQRAVKDDIDYLRNFLLRNERLELSIRHPDKRKWLIKWGQQIIDTVLFYAQSVQSLPAGWSSDPDIKLKKEQQYFLDPFRDDDAFQAARKATDWQATVSQDFAVWLNTRLIGREKQFTPQPEHRKLWALLMSDTLRILSPSLATSYQPEQEVVV